MAKQSKRQQRLEAKRQDGATDTIEMGNSKFICVFDVKTSKLLTYDFPEEDWNEISNYPDLKIVPTNYLSRFASENFNDDKCAVLLVALVQRHLNDTDAALLDVIKKQKHNTFVIIIDVDKFQNEKIDLPSFVFASQPCDNITEANLFGNGISHMYLETSKNL